MSSMTKTKATTQKRLSAQAARENDRKTPSARIINAAIFGGAFWIGCVRMPWIRYMAGTERNGPNTLGS
ncbi:hypothetical protein D9M70_520560 [compost metagenome]